MDHGYRHEDRTAGISVIYKPRAHTNPVRHHHGFWEILYLASGERTFFHGSATWLVRAGDALFVRPQVLHRALNRHERDCSLYNLSFPALEASPFAQILPLLESCATDSNPVITVPEGERYRIIRLFSDIARELELKRAGYENAAWASAFLLLVSLSRLAADRTARAEGSRPGIPLRAEIAALVGWLDAHYAESVSLSVLAERASLSPAYLSRLFHRETRFTVTEYLAALRVREACRLLSETRLGAWEIAERCGFGSAAQFGRVFRGLTGQSPVQWRKAQAPARY